MAVDPKAISPNSTAYGDRQTLEAGLSQAGGGGEGGAPTGAGPAPILPATGNPLGDMLSGAITPDSSGPLTEGLSVGPGAGPIEQPPGPYDNDEARKLQELSTQSTSPTLRRLAQIRLQQIYKGEPSGS